MCSGGSKAEGEEILNRWSEDNGGCDEGLWASGGAGIQMGGSEGIDRHDEQATHYNSAEGPLFYKKELVDFEKL